MKRLLKPFKMTEKGIWYIYPFNTHNVLNINFETAYALEVKIKAIELSRFIGNLRGDIIRKVNPKQSGRMFWH